MIPSLDDVPRFLAYLGYSEQTIREILRQVRYFEEEAPVRDNIIEEYFDEKCIKIIVDAIVDRLSLLDSSRINLLDVGVGSGYFTSRVINALLQRNVNVTAYGLDVTPSMLRRITTLGITPIWGTADRLVESMELARVLGNRNLPTRFNAIISTFALHHIPNPSRALLGMAKVLEPHGLAVIVEVSKYNDSWLQEKLGDVHPGFEPRELQELGKRFFEMVQVEELSNVKCKVEGRELGVIISVLLDPRIM